MQTLPQKLHNIIKADKAYNLNKRNEFISKRRQENGNQENKYILTNMDLWLQ